jgi:hypothetical protein
MQELFNYLNSLPGWVVIGGVCAITYLYIKTVYGAEIKAKTHPDYQFVPGCFTILVGVFLSIAYLEFRYSLITSIF